MAVTKLWEELTARKALIVHCSRPGKGNEGADVLLFPDDMNKAIRLCDKEKKEVCCSVIWPNHIKTFGDVGIVLKPRSTESVTMICTTDGGTSLDPKTGRRIGAGDPFSQQGVADTFEDSTGHNEWNTDDADTVGIFVKNPSFGADVASWVDPRQLDGYEPIMGVEPFIGSRIARLSEIVGAFPNLPVLTIRNGEIVDLHGEIVSPYL